jgi:hypothetical protein
LRKRRNNWKSVCNLGKTIESYPKNIDFVYMI